LTTAMLLAMCYKLSSLGSTTEGNNNHVSTNTDVCVTNITHLDILYSKEVTAIINW
jgi:hypothetical protein